MNSFFLKFSTRRLSSEPQLYLRMRNLSVCVNAAGRHYLQARSFRSVLGSRS